MTAVVPHAAATDLVRQLPRTLKDYADFDRTVEALAAGLPASIDGVWGSACALVAAALSRHATAPLLVVLPTQREADDTAGDLELFTSQEPRFFPAWETAEDERLVHDETFGERLRILKQLIQELTAASPKSKVEGRKSQDEPRADRASGLGRFIQARSIGTSQESGQ